MGDTAVSAPLDAFTLTSSRNGEPVGGWPIAYSRPFPPGASVAIRKGGFSVTVLLSIAPVVALSRSSAVPSRPLGMR